MACGAASLLSSGGNKPPTSPMLVQDLEQGRGASAQTRRGDTSDTSGAKGVRNLAGGGIDKVDEEVGLRRR